MLSVTVSDATHELLRRTPNKSDYVDAVLAHYPPPEVKGPSDIAKLVRAKHPWVTDPFTQLARDGLPSFGGRRPDAGPHGDAACWSTALVVSRDGVLWGRRRWEQDAIEAKCRCVQSKPSRPAKEQA